MYTLTGTVSALPASSASLVREPGEDPPFRDGRPERTLPHLLILAVKSGFYCTLFKKRIFRIFFPHYELVARKPRGAARTRAGIARELKGLSTRRSPAAHMLPHTSTQEGGPRRICCRTKDG